MHADIGERSAMLAIDAMIMDTEKTTTEWSRLRRTTGWQTSWLNSQGGLGATSESGVSGNASKTLKEFRLGLVRNHGAYYYNHRIRRKRGRSNY